MGVGLNSGDSSRFMSNHSEIDSTSSSPAAEGGKKKRGPPPALMLDMDIIGHIGETSNEALTGDAGLAGRAVMGALKSDEQAKLETVTSHFFKPSESVHGEVVLGDIGPVLDEEGENIGKASAHEVALTRQVAAKIFEEGVFPRLKDNQEVSVKDGEKAHTFTVIQTGDRVFSLVSPFILGSGANKDVYLSIGLREEGKLEEAFAFSEDQRMKLYSRADISSLVPGGGTGADEVIRRMLLFTGSENIAAPHYVVVNQTHEKYGGLLFPLLTGGNYGAFFDDLRDKMSVGPRASRLSLELLTDSAQGLAEIHSKGLVHGDVKKENLMVDQRSTADGKRFTGKVCDLDGLFPKDSSTPIMRTQMYCSPQAMGFAVTEGYDYTKDDVWSLGMTFAEVLTGKPLYKDLGIENIPLTIGMGAAEADYRGRFQEKLAKYLGESLPDNFAYKEDFSRLICRMMDMSGETRPLMQEVVAELRSMAA